MHLTHHTDGRRFLEAAGDFLYRDEVLNGVLIGIAARADHHTAADQTPYLATVSNEQGICAAAVMTPPHRLLIGADPDDRDTAVHRIAADLVQLGRQVPGVTAPVALADAFAGQWSQHVSCHVRRGMRMMVFELRHVRRPTDVSGAARWTQETDEDLLVEWLDAFNEELRQTPRPSRDQLRVSVREKIAAEDLLVWEDGGRVVSLAGRSRPSPRGTAINCVRTPPAFRRRGYASACVAELSQRILDEGKLFCTLFTDLANPTPNHIYREIGYQSRGEFVELHFDEPA